MMLIFLDFCVIWMYSSILFIDILSMHDNIIIVTKPISLSMIKKMAKQWFGDFVKAVVDLQHNIIAINSELHADAESILLQHWSKQENIWWINLYPEEYNNQDRIEFDSLINIRPSANNRSRWVEDKNIQKQIQEIVNLLIKK